MRTALTLDEDVTAKLKANLDGTVGHFVRSSTKPSRAAWRAIVSRRPNAKPKDRGPVISAIFGRGLILDANLLIYAYHPMAEQHEQSRAWLETAFRAPELVRSRPGLVRFAWVTLPARWLWMQFSPRSRSNEATESMRADEMR